MKKSILAAVSLIAFSAQANRDLQYTWVPMNESQEQAIAYNCSSETIMRRAGLIAGATSVSASGAVLGPAISVQVPIAVVPGMILSGMTIMAAGTGIEYGSNMMKLRLSRNSLLMFVSEQQSGSKGLATKQIETLAYQNGVDVNVLTANINKFAILGSLCRSLNFGTTEQAIQNSELFEETNRRYERALEPNSEEYAQLQKVQANLNLIFKQQAE